MLVPVNERAVSATVEELYATEEATSADIFGSPKPDENKNISLDGTINEDSNQSLAFVAPELLAEEEKVRTLNKKLDKEDNVDDEFKELSAEERYTKLMDLLNKSQFYSKFLLEKIQTEDEDTKLLKQKNLKERRSKVLQNPPQLADSPKRTPKGRKRPQNDEEDSENIAPNAVEVSSRSFKGEPIPEEQPLLLSGGIMRDYQLKGYQWMATLFENGVNGILADEMGLGKTIQTIALFCHLIEMGVPGPFLIVAPLSTISNWVKEFKTFAPELPVVLYHGNQKERLELRKKLRDVKKLTSFETPRNIRSVFVTSYEIAMNDRPHFKTTKWRYLVVDEGHRLKNMHCKLIRELKQYDTTNKLLLTGTPLQNNLDELWSLLNFLMTEIFDDLRVFKSWFDPKNIDISGESEQERIIRQERQGNILNTLHQILTPFLLRRVKADVDLKIPPKKEVLVYCPMTKKQQDMYEAIVSKTIQNLLQDDEVKLKNDPAILNSTENGGRSRRSIEKFDYRAILRLENLESEKNFDKYMEIASAMHEEREKKLSTVTTAYGKQLDMNRKNDTNFCLKNRMMDLRKCTNHPYLLEYPLSEDGFYYRIDEDLLDICGKMKVLDQMLNALVERQHKVLVFSQMTRMLDIIQDFCNLRGYVTSRLDGSMTFEDRQKNIDSFNEDENVRIFLLSTRAGGLGINLTSADTCIIYDSDWNPQQDLQAQDRCHRIGQTKPVMVYRLVTANTIDEKIVERAAAKRKLEKLIIHSKKFKSQDSEGLKKTMEAISPHELLELLNSKDHAGVVDRKDGPVFKPEELELLLDRSDLTWSKQKKIMMDEHEVKRKKARLSNPLPSVKESSLFKVIDIDESANTFPSVK